ncbi:MAG: hypothetical protein V3S51_04545 [Dehalococcoidia bacterium]
MAGRKDKNVMIYLSDPDHACWMRDMFTGTVSARVGFVFHAETPSDLVKITSGSSGTWGLAVVDTAMLAVDETVTDTFLAGNKDMVVGVEYEPEARIPVGSPVRSAIMFHRPRGDDQCALLANRLVEMIDR